jgi:hypothetical protein
MKSENLEQLEKNLILSTKKNDLHHLMELYHQAVNLSESINKKCFHLTTAYILSLEVNRSKQIELYEELRKFNRI